MSQIMCTIVMDGARQSAFRLDTYKKRENDRSVHISVSAHVGARRDKGSSSLFIATRSMRQVSVCVRNDFCGEGGFA